MQKGKLLKMWLNTPQNTNIRSIDYRNHTKLVEGSRVHWRLAPVEVQGILTGNAEDEDIVSTIKNNGAIRLMAIALVSGIMRYYTTQ